MKRRDEKINELTVSNTQKDDIISGKDQEIERLNKLLREKDCTIKSLARDQGVNEAVQQESEGLKKQVEELKTKTNLMGTLQKKCETLRNERKALRESFQQKKVELEEGGEEKKALEDKVKGLESTIRGLEVNIQCKGVEVNKLQEQLDIKDIELKKKEEECEALKNEKNDFEQQKQELEEARRKNAELKEKVRDLNNTILMLEQKLKELTAKLDETKENEDLNNQLNNLKLEYNRELERLNSELAAEKEQVKALEEKEHTLDKNLIALRGALNAFEERERGLENQISELQEELRLEKVQHEEELEVLRNKLEEAEEGKKRLEEQITELQEQVKELKANKGDVQNTLNQITNEKGVKLVEYEQEVKRLDKALTDQRREWDVALNHEKGEVKRLKDIVSQKNDDIKELGEKIKKLNEISDEAIVALAGQRRLVTQLKDEQKKIPDLTKKVEELQKEKVRLEGEKKKSVEVFEGTKKELDEKKESVEKLESEYKKRIEDLENDIVQLKDQLKTSVAEVEKLQEEKKTTNAMNVDSLKMLNERNENFKEAASQKIEQLESELAVANGTIARLKKKNQSPQREELEPQQLKAPKLDAVSIGRISQKSHTSLSKLGILLQFQSLEDFLTDQNTKLKESFPEFQGKHFCHTAVEEVEKCLSNKNGGKFEIEELFTLLQDNLKKLAKKIIDDRVIEVVNAKDKQKNDIYYDSGKAINAALIRVKKEDTKKQAEKEDTTVEKDFKSQLLLSVAKCMKELGLNEKDASAPTDSIMATFKKKKEKNNNELSVLLKEIVVEGLVNVKMMLFSNKVQEVASSITSKFLSPDQKKCEAIQGEINTYQLNQKIVKKYKNPHNSEMNKLSDNQSHTASAPVPEPKPEQSDIKESSAPKPRMDQPRADRSLAASVPVAASKQRGGVFGGWLFAANKQASQQK